jgi:hypothetical protein
MFSLEGILRSKFEDENLSAKFSAKMEIHKIDSCSRNETSPESCKGVEQVARDLAESSMAVRVEVGRA